jgi:DNA-binding response OmpR family regulator
MFRILIADDEEEIRNLLELYLQNAGYEVVKAGTGKEALDVMRSQKIDLCLLDIMMPEMDGFHVLKELRTFSNMPVIILSAKDQDTDKILGLNLGADDYIVKPFNPLEAVARVNSNIRRFTALGGASGGSGGDVQRETPKLVRGDLTLDPVSCQLMRGNRKIDLTASEYRIMCLFMENPGRVFTKQQIGEAGWGDYVTDNSIMVCISKLREKLAPENPNAYIVTIRGLGYRFRG